VHLRPDFPSPRCRIKTDHFKQVLDGLILAFVIYRVNGLLYHPHCILRYQVCDLAAQRGKICGRGRRTLFHEAHRRAKEKRAAKGALFFPCSLFSE
jgi:hypothetical protein